MRPSWLSVTILAAAVLQLRAASVTLAEFPFEYREGLMWIAVTVPQSEKPLQFLLDTGASVSVINLHTARRIGLRFGPAVPVRGVQSVLAGFWPQRLSAKVCGVPLPREYLAVDLAKLSGSCERPVDGLIGADFFRGRVVQIDFVQGRIRLLKTDGTDPTADGVRLRLGSSGMLLPIDVGSHEQQWVRLDTGCASALQWVASDAGPGPGQSQMAVGLADLSIPQTDTKVRIGKHEFENVPTGLHQEPIFAGEAGLLGNGLLRRFESVTIDSRSGQLILGRLDDVAHCLRVGTPNIGQTDTSKTATGPINARRFTVQGNRRFNSVDNQNLSGHRQD